MNFQDNEKCQNNNNLYSKIVTSHNEAIMNRNELYFKIN